MDASAALHKEGVVEAKKKAELLFNELQATSATFVPIPPNQDVEDQCMEDANGGRVTRRRIAIESGGLSDSAKYNSGGVVADEECLQHGCTRVRTELWLPPLTMPRTKHGFVSIQNRRAF